MRSFIFLCCIFIFFCLTSFSQEKEWAWSIQSFSTGQNFTTDLVIDDANNSYFTGFYYSDGFQIGDSVFSGEEGNSNAFIASYDWEGKFRWAVSLPKATESPFGMVTDSYLAVDSQQNLYVTGSFSFSVDFGDTVFYAEGYWDTFIAKYDSAGRFIWAYHINGPTSNDQVTDIKIDGSDNLYLSITHSRHGFNNTVVFGNNDTTITFHNCCGSVLSLKPDASFSWLSCGTSESDIQYDNLTIDEENNIYVQLFFLGNFLFNGDTIEDDLNPYTHMVIPFDACGKPGEYHKFPHYWIDDMRIDKQGDFLAAGVFNEPLIILGDTLNPIENYDFLLVKYNHQIEPVWYLTFPNKTYMSDFALALGRDDMIYISTPFEGTLLLGDTILQSEGPVALFIAQLDPSGDMIRVTTVSGSDYLYSSALNLDHCGNLLLCGGFTGEIYFGDDTLTTQEEPEVLLAKLAGETGTVSLGNDTLIYISDILFFSVDPQAGSILWSDGSTGADYVFNAADFGEGNHIVWVLSGAYGCLQADSINIHVVDNSSLDEESLMTDLLYPNPAKEKLYYNLNHTGLKSYDNLVVEIVDLKGQLLINRLIGSSIGYANQGIVMDISPLTGGMYFLLLKEDRKVISEKKFIVIK